MYLGAFMLLWRAIGLIAWPVLWWVPRARRHMTRVPFPTPGRTWIHGASLGEHRIVEALTPHIGPCWRTSSSWRTPVSGAFPAPLDLPLVIGPWLDRARPRRIILVEAEIWPGWLMAARQRGIPVTIIGARRGAGWQRWQWLRPVFDRMMSGVQWIDAADTGPLKATAPPPKTHLRLPANNIVAASLRSTDEPHLLEAWSALPEPRPLLLIAPRHLDRTRTLLDLWRSHGAQRRSMLDVLPQSGVVILDTHGELDALIPQAHTVFVGGTFDPDVGGHDPSWAHRWGAHIIGGPHRDACIAAWRNIDAPVACDGPMLRRLLADAQTQPRSPANPPDIDLAALVARLPEGVHQAERPHRPWLWLLTPIWRGLSAVHRRIRQPVVLPNPCVVVGGVVAGGAGRTPVTGWLADHLPQAVVLSAGYRRQGTSKAVRHAGCGEDLGDELEMLHRRGQTVISSPNRLAALEEIPSDRTVIIDGGMSDRRLDNAFRIAVVDAERPTGGGPLPVGSQRLPWSMLNDADAIWLTHCGPGIPDPPLPASKPIIRSHARARSWIHQGTERPLDELHGAVDVAVGIACPERFVCTLLDLGLQIRSLKVVRDHGDLGQLKPGTVVTEKDAARLPPEADVWALRLDLQTSGTADLLTAIAEHHP
jgi:tetraacyldisaccharide 4'-kinase